MELFLAWRLYSAYPTLCCKEIWSSPKISVLPSGTLSWTPNSGKFRHGKSIALSTTFVVVVVDGRACRRHPYDSWRVVAVFRKSVNCNPLIPQLRFVVDLHLLGVRSSVCPSVPLWARSGCCRFAAVPGRGGHDISIDCCTAGERGQCHVVSVRQQQTRTTKATSDSVYYC